MHEDHENTQDLRTRLTPPAPRFAGRKMLIAGIALCVTHILLCLAAAVVAEHGPVFDSRAAQLFAILYVTAIVTLGGAFIICGSMARHLQKQLDPFRTFVAEQIRATEGVEKLAKRLSVDTHERYDNLIGIVGVLPGRLTELIETLDERLAAVEKSIEKVPAASEAFLAGMTLRTRVDDEDIH